MLEGEREKFEMVKARLREEAEHHQLRMQQEAEQNRIRMQQEAEQHRIRLQQEIEQHKAKMQLEANLTIQVEKERSKITIETKEAEQGVLEAHASFDLAKNIKLVPNFTEYDPEDYFRLFEETAEHLNWPEEQWIWLIKPKLSGKAG